MASSIKPIKDFSQKKVIALLSILTIIGFCIRLVASLNLGVFADDVVYSSQSAGIIGSGVLSTHSNPPLFFYLTDFAYQIFGYSTFASRFWPLAAGTLLIPLVFFLTLFLLKNKKLALLSAFFVTFSTFLIRMTFTEQTLLVLFFTFFGITCFLKYLEDGKKLALCLSIIGFGLGLLTKYSAPFFLISFTIFLGYLYEQNKNLFKNKINLKFIFLIISGLLIFSIPFIAFNLIIFKEKGIVDVYFSRLIPSEKTQQLYGDLSGQGESFSSKIGDFDTYNQYKLPFITDPLISLLGLFGLFSLIKKKEKIGISFILIMLLVPFILQSAGSNLQKHFAFMVFILAIPAAVGTMDIISRMKNKSWLLIFSVFIFAIIILSLGTSYGTPKNLMEKSATSELKSFLNEKVDEEDLIIFDTRIYTSKSFWLASPNNFVLLSQFPQIYEASAKLPRESLKQTDVFFVECVTDDCGWGWVGSNSELNGSSEQLTAILSQNAVLLKSISEPSRTNNEFLNPGIEQEIYKVHYISLNLPLELGDKVRDLQSFYFVPYMYSNMDNYLFKYEVSGLWKILNKVGFIIIYLSVFLTLAIFLLFLIFLIKQRN